MKINKKLFLIASISVFSLSLDAMTSGKMGDVPEMISMEQLQQFEEMQQVAGMVSMIMTPKFLAKFSNFKSDAVAQYSKNPAAIEKSVLEKVENPAVFEPLFADALKEMGVDKKNEAVFADLKPLVKQLFAQDIMKWIHITATAGIKI